MHFDDILTLGIKILIRSGGRYCSYNNKYGHNLDPTYLKGIKMQSPFCILTSYHGKFRNLGNLYISTFSTSTWLYCPFRIQPVSSTSALSFLRKKIKSFNYTKLTTNSIDGNQSHFYVYANWTKSLKKILGFTNIHYF